MAVRLGFGDFELDVAAYTLRRHHQRVRLQRIPMELLRLLVEGRGALIDRAQIQAALWGGDVFVDQEAAINTAVRKLRLALDDHPDHPRFIETAVGKGYRFIAVVRDVPLETAAARDTFPKYILARGQDEFALRRGDNLVGRDQEADIYIDHPSVSRRHARICIRPNRAFIEDLRSRNGTFVDGHRLDQRAELRQDAIIGIGPITLTFHVMAAPPSTKPMSGAHRVRS